MKSLRPDPFTLVLLATIALASMFPAGEALAGQLSLLGKLAVALLFFIHGAALSTTQIRAGATHWQLHLFISTLTFIVFPLLVLPVTFLPAGWMPEALAIGFLYLGELPSAVSSSIAFTAMAKGNLPAAICSAAASNVFGMMLTPFLLILLVSTTGDAGFNIAETLRDIFLQLLLPFALGHGLRRWLGPWLDRNPRFSSRYDQGVILLIVYNAFSQSITDGLWQQLPLTAIALTLGLCLLLLGVLLILTTRMSRKLGFSKEDEIAAVFCGSKKSLASGLPMANVLFVGNPALGMIVLPIMCYNQLQILVGAGLARRYLQRR